MRKITLLLAIMIILAGCSSQDDLVSLNTSSQAETSSSQDPQVSEPEPIQELEPFIYPMDQGLPDDLRRLVAENREPVFKAELASADEVKNRYMPVVPDKELDQRIASQVSSTFLPYPASLTAEQAEKELEFLFGYLKCGYSGYGYFGGDAVFELLQSSILQDVINMGRDITVQEYSDILEKHFSTIIMDCHFSIGAVQYGDLKAYKLYSYSEDVLFEKQDNGFHTTIEDTDYLLRTVDGKPPEDYLKPILTSEGQMAWAVGLSHQDPIGMAVELELYAMSNGNTIKTAISLTTAPSTPKYSDSTKYRPYELEEVQGIPVIHNRRLWTDSEQDEHDLQKMVDDASSLRDEKVIIVDLRGNGGGSSDWADNWIQAFSGEYPDKNSIYCVMQTQTVNSSYGDGGVVESPGWTELEIEPSRLIENNTFVVVLTDKNVGSSGEIFFKNLRQMENVLIIGTNTLGCQMFGDARSIYLPESHLRLQCGYKLFIEPDLQFTETIGLMPDLWAPSDQALDRAIQLINNYFS